MAAELNQCVEGSIWTAKVTGGLVRLGKKVEGSNGPQFKIINLQTGNRLKDRTRMFLRRLISAEELKLRLERKAKVEEKKAAQETAPAVVEDAPEAVTETLPEPKAPTPVAEPTPPEPESVPEALASCPEFQGEDDPEPTLCVGCGDAGCDGAKCSMSQNDPMEEDEKAEPPKVAKKKWKVKRKTKPSVKKKWNIKRRAKKSKPKKSCSESCEAVVSHPPSHHACLAAFRIGDYDLARILSESQFLSVGGLRIIEALILKVEGELVKRNNDSAELKAEQDEVVSDLQDEVRDLQKQLGLLKEKSNE